MPTTHFRNGVSNQVAGNPLYDFPYLDPFKYVTYANDFFTYHFLMRVDYHHHRSWYSEARQKPWLQDLAACCLLQTQLVTMILISWQLKGRSL